MGFVHEYPYTDFHEMNLDWILSKIKEFQERLDAISITILDEAKAYTDEQITIRLANVENEFAQFKAQVEAYLAGLDDRFEDLVDYVNDKIDEFESQLPAIYDSIQSAYENANAYTNRAIEDNNTYLINEIVEGIGRIKVINYFTGEMVSIQQMFDYLASLHATNGIDVNTLIARNKTVNELIALNATVTDIATNGSVIIV